MPISPEEFTSRLNRLRSDLVEQGRRVQSMLEGAFDAFFAWDVEQAERVIEQDDVIDRVDVGLEKASVGLLTEAVNAGGKKLDAEEVRAVLTIVKVNNELERVADLAAVVGEFVKESPKLRVAVPTTVRVMTNSIVGILRDVNRSLERGDAELAMLVLRSEDAVERFKRALLRDVEERIAAGGMGVDNAFLLHEIATVCERMADHCTNIAEQIIYASTGKIVRHTEGQWREVEHLAR
jgi:phosphate transport system protein